MAYLTPLLTELRAANLKVLSGSMNDCEVLRSELVLLMWWSRNDWVGIEVPSLD
jgi:hypothetical protein